MLDNELAILWQQDVQRERNPAFALVLIRRMEQSIFRRAVALNLAAVAAATLLLFFCVPALTAAWRQTFAHFVSAPVVAFLFMVLSYALSKLSTNLVRVNGQAKER